jgi:hypothetical protein
MAGWLVALTTLASSAQASTAQITNMTGSASLIARPVHGRISLSAPPPPPWPPDEDEDDAPATAQEPVLSSKLTS